MVNQKSLSPFITYLRQEMIFQHSPTTKLKGLVDKKMDSLSSEEKIDLLLRISKLKYDKHIDAFYLGEIQDFFEYVLYLIQDLKVSQSTQELYQLLSITTKAAPEEILNFWLKLQGNNEKGEPYWENRQEIEHFVYQNFEGFPGVPEIKEFTPNMNKSEMYQVVWTFFRRYGKYKTKRQYEKLLLNNFTQFRRTKNVYSNIKDHSKDHLRRVTK